MDLKSVPLKIKDLIANLQNGLSHLPNRSKIIATDLHKFDCAYVAILYDSSCDIWDTVNFSNFELKRDNFVDEIIA